MPRSGRHPLKTTDFVDTVSKYRNITITTIVYIPMLSGYWRESFEVLKLFFSSLIQNTSQPFDLMVFDNGSCLEVQDYLLDLKNKGQIQYLIFSQHNLRKFGALNYLLATAPGDFVAYADSDVYFLPGWLDASLKVLSAFPEAGKVTALPIVMDGSSPSFGRIFSSAAALAEEDPTITLKTGALVPDVFVNAHRLSLGETADEYLKRLKQRNDLLIQREDCQAILSGADFQFTITKKAIREILPLEIENPEEVGDSIYSPVLEIRLAGKGFWQLSTSGYFVHHMGNHVPDLPRELPWLDQKIFPKTDAHMEEHVTGSENRTASIFQRILLNRFVRRLVKRIHTFTYRLLYES